MHCEWDIFQIHILQNRTKKIQYFCIRWDNHCIVFIRTHFLFQVYYLKIVKSMSTDEQRTITIKNWSKIETKTISTRWIPWNFKVLWVSITTESFVNPSIVYTDPYMECDYIFDCNTHFFFYLIFMQEFKKKLLTSIRLKYGKISGFSI